jgi:hypothetical protein
VGSDNMDENQYCDSVFIAPPTRMIKGFEYRQLCKRDNKKIAEALRDDMLERGKKAIMTEECGEFVVWWR